MSIKLYKTIEIFEHENKTLKLGDEIALSDRDAAKLIEKRLVVEGRLLDSDNPKDKKLIDAANKKHDEKHAEAVVKEKARDEQKQEELKEEDIKIKEEKEAKEEVKTPKNKKK